MTLDVSFFLQGNADKILQPDAFSFDPKWRSAGIYIPVTRALYPVVALGTIHGADFSVFGGFT